MSRLIDEKHPLPRDYSTPCVPKHFTPAKQTVDYKGRHYKFVGISKKKLHWPERAWLSIQTFAKTIFYSLTFFSHRSKQAREKLKHKWDIVRTGKKNVKVYQATSVETPAFKGKAALDRVIKTLQTSHDPIQKKKGALFQQALDLFSTKNCRANLQTFRLKEADQFKLSNKTTPSYFQQEFRANNPLNLTTTGAFYDYKTKGSEEYWVDFANASLGGGCFTHGFVQEEIMVAEMPDFAAHIANQLNEQLLWCNIPTRDGDLKTRNRVLQGSPNPYLLKGLHRVQQVDNALAYGNGISKLSQEALLESTKPLDTPQEVNVLAIAAPKLYRKNPSEQWDPRTLKDIFNTLMAGFTLVKEQSEDPVIHSGKLGCGAFNNDPHAVYLLHCLAAQHLGVQIKLHGYTKSETHTYQESWNRIAQQLEGQSLEECLNIISRFLHSHR